MRYVVTELRGYREIGSSRAGASYHVVDTACNRRLVRTWHSEDHFGYRATVTEACAEARRHAHAYAATLNADGQPKRSYRYRLRDHWPCPRCGDQVRECFGRCPRCGARMR